MMVGTINAVDGFNNKISLQDTFNTQITVKPDDEFITNDQGQEVANDIWRLWANLYHVLKFKTTHQEFPKSLFTPRFFRSRCKC